MCVFPRLWLAPYMQRGIYYCILIMHQFYAYTPGRKEVLLLPRPSMRRGRCVRGVRIWFPRPSMRRGRCGCLGVGADAELRLLQIFGEKPGFFQEVMMKRSSRLSYILPNTPVKRNGVAIMIGDPMILCMHGYTLITLLNHNQRHVQSCCLLCNLWV